MLEFWQGLSRAARTGIVVGAAVIALVFCSSLWWALRTDYQVLFTDLKPQDAQAMVGELERQKIDYRLADGGTAILVDARTVHATRLKLMGRDIPLHGAVGFELFNNTDFGMTEFAQKINFQRALQGELTRTIMSLSQIEEARVHLAIPEQSLFKQASASPKASVTLTLRAGQSLRPQEVAGIQRLVAAAVPGMAMQDVTLVDNHGVALTRQSSADAGGADAGVRLELKQDMENYLSRKAMTVLDRALGSGQALASVDVMLNMDQVRVTTEDVLGAPGRTGSAGVLVKEKESSREQLAPLDAVQDRARGAGGAQREAEYAVGRRVEQVIGQPGSVRKLQVVAVVRQPLDAAQEAQVRQLVGAAVGAMAERGDTVVVQTFAAFAAQHDAATTASVADQARDVSPASSVEQVDAPQVHRTGALSVPEVLAIVLGALALVALLAMVLVRRAAPVALGETERSAALARVRAWMAEPEAAPWRAPTQTP